MTIDGDDCLAGQLQQIGLELQRLLGPLRRCDVHEHDADTDDLVVDRNGVIARQPATSLARLGWGRHLDFQIEDCFTGVQHSAIEDLQRRPQLRDDRGHELTDLLDGGRAVDRSQRLVQSDEAEFAVDETEADRGLGLQRLEQGEGLRRHPVGQSQRSLEAFGFVDVGGGHDPIRDRSRRVEGRYTPHLVPSEGPIEPSHPTVDAKLLLVLDRLVPGISCRLEIVVADERQPIRSFVGGVPGGVGEPGEQRADPVQVVQFASRIGDPDEMWQRIEDEPKIGFVSCRLARGFHEPSLIEGRVRQIVLLIRLTRSFHTRKHWQAPTAARVSGRPPVDQNLVGDEVVGTPFETRPWLNISDHVCLHARTVVSRADSRMNGLPRPNSWLTIRC